MSVYWKCFMLEHLYRKSIAFCHQLTVLYIISYRDTNILKETELFNINIC